MIVWSSPVSNKQKLGQVDLHNSPVIRPEVQHKFSPPIEILHSIWTQVILQTTGIVLPHHPLFAVCVNGNFHGLQTIFWHLRVYSMTHTLNIPYMEENGHWEGQGWSADPPCLSTLYPQSALKFGSGSI